MQAVRLEDIIDVVVFQDLPSVESTKLNRFLDGGVVVQSELLNTLANGPGKTAELPFWNDLDGDDEVNYSTKTARLPRLTKASRKRVRLL